MMALLCHVNIEPVPESLFSGVGSVSELPLLMMLFYYSQRKHYIILNTRPFRCREFTWLFVLVFWVQ